MREIDVRELKAKTSEILLGVRQRRARYIITYRGQPVALLSPLEEQAPSCAAGGESTAWNELTRLGKEIGRAWPKGVSSADVLAEIRR